MREDGLDWRPAFGRIETVTAEQEPDSFFAGQTFEIAAALQPAPGPLAEGLFDYQKYLANQGIYYEMNIASTNLWKVIASPRFAAAVGPLFCVGPRGAGAEVARAGTNTCNWNGR